MATNCLQVNRLRRLVVLALPVFLGACISSLPFPQGTTEPQPSSIPAVRAPQVGQEWVYQVRNVFNQEIVDTVTERVVSVGNEIRVSRSGVKAGPLPDEIQSPWGFVVQDPHWNPVQIFSNPIPLWPTKLLVGWNEFFTTQYQVPPYPYAGYYWGLSMNAAKWERIKTPAGQFLALQIHNEIPNFTSNDVFRAANVRQEDLWFSPEVGRWVIRRGFGRYILLGDFWTDAYWEDYLEWELIAWK